MHLIYGVGEMRGNYELMLTKTLMKGIQKAMKEGKGVDIKNRQNIDQTCGERRRLPFQQSDGFCP